MSKNSPHVKPLLVRPAQLKELIGLSNTTVWRMENAGNFPKQKRFSTGSVDWLYSDIEYFVNNLETVA